MTQRGDAQYAPAAGHYLLVIRQFRARVEHFGVSHFFHGQLTPLKQLVLRHLRATPA